jgi:hypothetical protein
VGGHFPYIRITVLLRLGPQSRAFDLRWPRVKVDIEFFVKQLSAPLLGMHPRFLVIIKTFLFLRNLQRDSFNTIDRMNAQMNDLYTKVKTSNSKLTEAEATSGVMCQKYNQKSLHKVVRKSCPFWDLDDASARSAGTLAAKLSREG